MAEGQICLFCLLLLFTTTNLFYRRKSLFLRVQYINKNQASVLQRSLSIEKLWFQANKKSKYTINEQKGGGAAEREE